MGVTRGPNRRYLALGADARGIDQDLDLRITTAPAFGVEFGYSENLDTRYYGAFLALGGDYSPMLFKGLWGALGLQSSFRLQGGVYHADTDYSGNAFVPIGNAVLVAQQTGNLSLSNDEVAFIGGLTLETRKRLGRRSFLSLKSEYEYYSYVPEILYNNNDQRTGSQTVGNQVGTVISDNDAFSARTSLRLTIKLGPDHLF